MARAREREASKTTRRGGAESLLDADAADGRGGSRGDDRWSELPRTRRASGRGGRVQVGAGQAERLRESGRTSGGLFVKYNCMNQTSRERASGGWINAIRRPRGTVFTP